MLHPTDRIIHTTAFVTPVVEHWLEQEIAQWVHAMKDRSDDPSHHERTLLPQSYSHLKTVPKICLIDSILFKGGNVLFNDTLNTFYLELYGVGHMIKDHWLEWEIAQWVHPMKDRPYNTMSKRSYHGATSCSQSCLKWFFFSVLLIMSVDLQYQNLCEL